MHFSDRRNRTKMFILVFSHSIFSRATAKTERGTTPTTTKYRIHLFQNLGHMLDHYLGHILDCVLRSDPDQSTNCATLFLWSAV